MSYLDAPRLHFAGLFTANPSTINNTITNYNPNQQKSINLSWNPYGSHHWAIQCKVTSFVDSDGVFHDSGDPLIGAAVTSVPYKYSAPAKLVDLDVDQQTRTRLYGFAVQISIPVPGSSDSPLLTGEFLDTATLLNLWFSRVPSIQGDSSAGATLQSVLDGLKWDASQSPFLQQLYDAAQDGMLSISLSAYGYDDTSSSPNFRGGKIVGTIGPQYPGEPKHMIAARYISPTQNSLLWNAPAKVDTTRQTLTMDLSNALPDKSMGGPPLDVGPMQAAILPQSSPIIIGEIPYMQEQFQKSAGVIQFNLTADQVGQLADNPLGIMIPLGGPTTVSGDQYISPSVVAAQESADGMYVEVDRATLLLNPGDSAEVAIYATKFGQPQPNYQVPLALVPQPGPDGKDMNNNPADGIKFPQSVTTGADGKAQIPITAGDPSPKPERRRYVDGQLYFIGGPWASPADQTAGAPLTVKVFNSMKEIANPTWKDVAPILHQFYVLYAYMAGIVDLSNYESVKANAGQIKSVMELSMSDPAYMPVTREMSQDQAKLIIQWINNGTPT